MSDSAYLDELARQLFFLTSAGLGAVFAALYPITRAVAAGTYDENEDQAYITRIVVGLISGTILGQLSGLDELGNLGGLSKPTIAIIGGFSASLVFTILSRLVTGLESAFGEASPPAPEVAQARADAKVMDERLVITRSLAEFQAAELTGPEAEKLGEIVQKILRGELDR